MISRRTAHLLAEIIELSFRKHHSQPHGRYYYTTNVDELYDFLFDNDYLSSFCNVAKQMWSGSSTRPIKEFIMKIHTGESLYSFTQSWSWEQRQKLGQQYLQNLAEDIIIYWGSHTPYDNPKTLTALLTGLLESLQLDGYMFKHGKLLIPEEDVLDVQEDMGLLESLSKELKLENHETAVHHLKLSEEHYIAKKWDDSISNSRKFLECILQEVAAMHYRFTNKSMIPNSIYSYPVEVRKYLEKVDLVESKEREAIASIYGLLSHTGSHPYMAENDQARLLRHLALTISQFVMLRLKGKLASSP